MFEFLSIVADLHGCKLLLSRLDNRYYGLYIEDYKCIILDINLNRVQLISVFFHELAHSYCYAYGVYKLYHGDQVKMFKKLRTLKNTARYATTCEMGVDNIGKKMCKWYFPDLDYASLVKRKSDYKLFRQAMEDHFSEVAQQLRFSFDKKKSKKITRKEKQKTANKWGN